MEGARPDIQLRNYTAKQVARFLEDDRLTDAAEAIAERFSEVMNGAPK